MIINHTGPRTREEIEADPYLEMEVGIVTTCSAPLPHNVFVRMIGKSPNGGYPSRREFCGVCEAHVVSYVTVQRVYGE